MQYSFTDNGEREHVLRHVRRVVVKVGTRLLTDMPGSSEGERVGELIGAVAELRARGLEVIVVSSGAIGAGMTVLKKQRRPTSLRHLQAHAAVGQCRLMYLYETASVGYGFHSAQLLLTAADVQDRGRHLNVTNCLEALLASGVLPVINENDSVSVDEIRVGDNDVLAALVASMMRADLTILLTTVDGMRERTEGELGRRMSVVHTLDETVRTMAAGTDGNRFSSGGMETKVTAADIVTRAGEALVVADGRDFGILHAILAGNDTGTLFPAAQQTPMQAKRRYLAFFSRHRGEVEIDDGAVRALCERGRSLLPKGVVRVGGEFLRGDTIRIVDRSRAELARGTSNYDAAEMERIRGRRSDEILRVLGYAGDHTVVHRNNLVLTQDPAGKPKTTEARNGRQQGS